MMQKLSRIALIAIMTFGCPAAQADQCFQMGRPGERLDLVKGQRVYAVGALMFRTIDDMHASFVSGLGEKFVLGHIEKTDVVTSLQNAIDVCKSTHVIWVKNSRVGKVFIYLVDF